MYGARLAFRWRISGIGIPEFNAVFHKGEYDKLSQVVAAVECDNRSDARPVSSRGVHMNADEQLALNSACRRLAALRNFVVVVLSIAATVVYFDLAVKLPLAPMVVGMLTLILLNVFVYWHLRSGAPTTQRIVLTQLLIDVAVLTVLLYFAGGSANPFVSFYLLPLVITAVVLPRAYAGIMAAVTIACYSALMLWYVPLPAYLGHFQLHIVGMWCNFVLSAGLIVFFVAHMASALRARERELAQAREQALRNGHIVALGTLAAGAAHELATPLSTMAVITREMETATDMDAEHTANLGCLRKQIDTCKTTLERLRNYGAEQPCPDESADRWLRRLADDWRLLRPATPLFCRWRGPQPAPRVRCHDGLARTLTNLLNNAADASPTWVAMQGYATDGELVFEIQDVGAGLAADIRTYAQSPGITTKFDGHGVGLILANATVAHLGGRLQWFDRDEGGICARLALPLRTLEAT